MRFLVLLFLSLPALASVSVIDDRGKMLTLTRPAQRIVSLAPHITEELWSRLGYTKSLFLDAWPEWDESKILTETLNIAVQVNGKVRTVLTVAPDTDEKVMTKLALADTNVQAHLAGRTPRKIIFIPGKILSIVV